jgi:hypothetical protein
MFNPDLLCETDKDEYSRKSTKKSKHSKKSKELKKSNKSKKLKKEIRSKHDQRRDTVRDEGSIVPLQNTPSQHFERAVDGPVLSILEDDSQTAIAFTKRGALKSNQPKTKTKSVRRWLEDREDDALNAINPHEELAIHESNVVAGDDAERLEEILFLQGGTDTDQGSSDDESMLYEASLACPDGAANVVKAAVESEMAEVIRPRRQSRWDVAPPR